MVSPRRPELLEALPDLVAGLGIEAGGRLVEDQQLRLVEQRARQGQPPPQAAGEFADGGLRPTVEGEEVQQFGGPLSSLFAGDVEVAGEDQQVLQNVEVRVEGVFLLADADPPLDRAQVARQRQAENFQLPAADRAVAVEHADG